MKKKSQALETVVHGVFLLLGLITVGCVLLISVYLIVSGIPAIRQIGLIPFLFGKTWASTAAEPSYGILPFILTSVYGTAGAIVLGVPIGFLTAVYLAKVAPPRIRSVMSAAVSLLAGIPSVVYGLVGMLVLVPGIRKVFHLADGASRRSSRCPSRRSRPCRPSMRTRRSRSVRRRSKRTSRSPFRRPGAASPPPSCSASAAPSARPWPS